LPLYKGLSWKSDYPRAVLCITDILLGLRGPGYDQKEVLTCWPVGISCVRNRGAGKVGINQKAAPVQEALSAFLTAFDNLDWPYSAIVSARRQLFSIRRRRTLGELILPNSSKRHGSPSSSESRRVLIGLLNHTLLLNRSDLRVEELSEEVALVTFHLVDGGLVNRRTLVFKHKTSGWKIVHIHASNIAPP
jgi:SnoaL-like protein